MRILYKYLTTSLFPRHTEPEVWSFSLCSALVTHTHTEMKSSLFRAQIDLLFVCVCAWCVSLQAGTRL